MICPKCGSENVNVMVEQVSATTKGKNKGMGCLWALGRLILIVCTGGLWLLVGRRNGTSHSSTKFNNVSVGVCQNCGYKGDVRNFGRSVPKQQNYSQQTFLSHITTDRRIADGTLKPLQVNSNTFGIPANSSVSLWASHNPLTIQQMEEEISIYRKKISSSYSDEEKFEAINAYIEYLQVAKEYYSEIDKNAGEFFEKHFCQSSETISYCEIFDELCEKLNK